MPEQESIRVARAVFDAWNAHDLEAHAKLVDDNHIFESDTIPAPLKGREGARAFMSTYITAFPDLHLDVAQIFASGEFVAVRWTSTGTHRGDLMGIAPTNRAAVTHGCSILEVRYGKLVRSWIYWDTGNLLRQLGVLPAIA